MSNSGSSIRRFASALLLLLCGLAGCGLAGCRRSGPSSQAGNLDALAREYVKLAVALGERDPDALDYYSGPASDVADVRRNPPRVPQIRESALKLSGQVEHAAGDPGRKDFLLKQLRAIGARAGLLAQVHSTFDQEAEAFFGIHVTPRNAEQMAAVRRDVAAMLPGPGNPAQRYGRFEAGLIIPEERVPAVMERALQLCRAQTQQHVALPPGEKVRVEYVRNKPWSAYSTYQGGYQSLIQVNVDLGLTVDRALQLACHEGYPGHHVFNSLTDQNLVRAKNRVEFLVQPTFSPQSFLSEASATVAGDVAFSENERLQVERDVLYPLAGLKPGDLGRTLTIEKLVDALHPEELAVARDYLDERLEFIRAAAALEERALMAQSEATLRYLNEFRSYVVTYTEGRDRVAKWVAAAGSPDERWRRFTGLAATPGFIPPP